MSETRNRHLIQLYEVYILRGSERKLILIETYFITNCELNSMQKI